jgi:hypothetical protein
VQAPGATFEESSNSRESWNLQSSDSAWINRIAIKHFQETAYTPQDQTLRNEEHMRFERLSMNQFSEMKRLLELKLSDRAIAKTLKCRRSTVQAVRTGELKAQGVGQTETATPPHGHFK